MHEPENLYRLAALAGIEPAYWDIRGARHDTSAETARRLLSALGFAVQDEAAIANSLTALEEEEWRWILPPVTVARQDEPLVVPVHLPGELPGQRLVWSIITEDGPRQSGEQELDSGFEEIARAIAGRVTHRRQLCLPMGLPLGYHMLHIEAAGISAAMPLIITPAKCYLPPQVMNGKRCWGIAAQLYAVRSRDNWGAGDFSDLIALTGLASGLGAAAVGLNPLHALFPGAPEQASPYSPNSRLFLNPIYLDVTAVPEFAESEQAKRLVSSAEFTETIDAARASELVDYTAVTHHKLAVLELLYEDFCRTHLSREGDARAAAFRAFQMAGGERLHRFAQFQALTETFHTNDWTRWPARYHDPASPAVAAFAHEHERRIDFFQYLQWQAHEQLMTAQHHARHSGMIVGLYGDLAVSVDPSGADHWAEQSVFASQARVGAPPDPFNALGQEWGLAPLNPRRLRETAYAHFIALLRANMRHMGALRIDHVMGLQRLFWVPAGEPASLGAYVRYPFEDLLGLLALESERNKCMVIGEDLGTVPEGFRPRMAMAGILSYKVLYFEKTETHFRPPDDYPALATACASTHDLATLDGFWTGTDLAVRAQLRLYQSDEQQYEAQAARAQDRRHLLHALAQENLLPADIDPDRPEQVAMTPALRQAIYAFLARSPACLLMVELDDLTEEQHQANLPGTVLEHPNWRRRLSRDLDQIRCDPVLRDLAAAIARERA